MISRKEREVQKALGLENDIPPTIYKRVKYWWWYQSGHYKWEWRSWTFYQWLAPKLPRKLVYFVAIRVWAYATTRPSSSGECVGETTMDNAIKRWEKE